MAVIVAGFRGVWSADDATAAVDGIVPVVVMMGGGAVPSPVLVDQRRVVPIVAGVLSTDHNGLAGIAHSPNIGCADVADVPFYAARRLCRWSENRMGNTQYSRVRLDAGHIGSRSQCFYEPLATDFYVKQVDNVKGLIGHPA